MNIKIIFYVFLSSSLYLACSEPKLVVPVLPEFTWTDTSIRAWVNACQYAQQMMNNERIKILKAQEQEAQRLENLNHGFNPTNKNVINASKQ